MTDIYNRDLNKSPEEEAAGKAEREARERIKRARATQRLIGSYMLGIFSMWKMTGADGGELFTWIGAFCLAFGLASVDQILKALGKS